MKKQEAKPLKGELLQAVNKVLKHNKTDLTKKIKKIVNKSIKRIVKKTTKLNSEVVKNK